MVASTVAEGVGLYGGVCTGASQGGRGGGVGEEVKRGGVGFDYTLCGGVDGETSVEEDVSNGEGVGGTSGISVGYLFGEAG